MKVAERKAVTEPQSHTVQLRLLGPMELSAAGRVIALPRSKKTRALLAYLAMTSRAHRRERLCSLLWDVTDDPRGALRWSLSRLRSAFGSEAARVLADQQEVSLSTAGMLIDAAELAGMQRPLLQAMDISELEQAAMLYRGEFLEGLELSDFLDFSAWCIEQREQSRRRHCELLDVLVQRLRGEPRLALPYARQRVQVDVFALTAYQALLQLLLELGHTAEAQQRFEHAQRLFRQVSAPDALALDQAWRALRATAAPQAPTALVMATGLEALPKAATDLGLGIASPPFVGRQRTLVQLEAVLEESQRSRAVQLALVLGEAGMGKSRLAERLSGAAGARGLAVITGRAFESESTRPFGPWADALGVDIQQTVISNNPASREGLFDMLRARLATLAEAGQGVLLVLDDLQWFDRNSTELLHYLVRTYDRGPLAVLMLARGGELPDNEAASRLLRSLRRERAVLQIELEPLASEDIETLTGEWPGIDGQRVRDASAGNPLYALEYMRGLRQGLQGTPPTLLQLVRERVAKLPDAAADVLRWGAVLGHAIEPARLEGLLSQSAEEMVDALERLEQASLLRIDTTRVRERYVFGHDLIREAVYGELSQPRRRLMHRKVALQLEAEAVDPAVAAELAHHASLAGEALLGARACIAAGHHALRVFANDNAEALARRGLRLVDELDASGRIEPELDLLQVLYTARAPERDEAALRVGTLAEQALDLGLTRAARQGFQMLSFLRWEGSSLADAHANILQAERVSRLAEPGERAFALAQAARCLILLERNLPQAEAFVLEANAVGRRDGRTSAAVSFALGMIAAHRGDAEATIEAFDDARHVARQQGEHLAEFGALEHCVMFELDRGQYGHAAALAAELVELGRRLRPGAEVHCAQALLVLAQAQEDASDEQALEQAVDAVRRADAKYELSYLLTRWAEWALDRGRLQAAAKLATEAQEVAQTMGRSSEVAAATVILANVAQRQRSSMERKRQLERLEAIDAKNLSARSRRLVALLEPKRRRD